MTIRARAMTVGVGVAVAFVLTFSILGYFIGVSATPNDLYGWPAALIVGGIALATVLGFLVLVAIGGILAYWVYKGDQR